MSAKTTPAEVRVRLGDADAASAESVREAAHRTLVDLAAQLDLPIAPSVTTEAGDRIEVWINGVQCGLAERQYLLRHTAALAARVVETLHMRVGLLVTPAVTEIVWADRTARGAVPIWLAGLLRDLVEHRVRLGRLAELTDLPGSPTALFEATLSAAGRPPQIWVDPLTMQCWTTEARTDFLPYLATGLSTELGLPLPVPELRLDTELPEGCFAVELNDLRTPPLPGIRPGQILVSGTRDRVALIVEAEAEADPVVEAAINPSTGFPAALTSATHADALERLGMTTWTLSGYLTLTAAAAIRRYAAVLYRQELLRYQLAQLAPEVPVLEPMVEAIGGVEQLVRVLRQLVREGVPVADLYGIVDALYGSGEPPAPAPGLVQITTRRTRATVIEAPEIDNPLDAVLAETARQAMSWAITHKYARATSTLVVFLLGRDVERRLRDPAALATGERRTLLDRMSAELAALPEGAQRPVILTRSLVRARLRAVIAAEQPAIMVLAYEELPGDLNIQPVARIELVPDRLRRPQRCTGKWNSVSSMSRSCAL